MPDLRKPTISFAEFEIDTGHRRLVRGGEAVVLNAKAFDVLTFLAINSGRIVTKDEIIEAVWDDKFVEEANLVVQISNLRRVLGDTRNSPRFLVTIPGKGYKFVADIAQNGFVVETHTVSELTIEHEEFTPDRSNSHRAINRKWPIIASAAVLVILAIGYWNFVRPGVRKDMAFGWVDPARRTSPRQLTANGRINVAAMSPDGTLYAYTNEGSETSGLWVAGITSTQTIEVLPPSAITFFGLTFSPDGLQIYYTARDEKNRNGALFRVPALSAECRKKFCQISVVRRPFRPTANRLHLCAI